MKMNKNKEKQIEIEILRILEETGGGTTFVEFERDFDKKLLRDDGVIKTYKCNFLKIIKKGDNHDSVKNLVLWESKVLPMEFFEVLHSLIKQKKIKWEIDENGLIYYMDGRLLNYPIFDMVNLNSQSHQTRWIPILWSLVKINTQIVEKTK